MIHIFFVPGMFGSTVEYVLRCYTHEYVPTHANILDDGSMHEYGKEFHLYDQETIDEFIQQSTNESIVTTMYPFKEKHLPEILSLLHNYTNGRNILIHAKSQRDAELNMLFKFYKIAVGSRWQRGVGIFCGDNQHNIVAWNPTYTHWSDMQHWELREWISLFYPSWTSEWINSELEVGDEWLKITNASLLNSPVQTWTKIIDYCGLTAKSGIEEFATKWTNAQQYIVNEFDTIDKIVHNTLSNESFAWDNISIIGEAIVQQRLRENNFEIRCDGLNMFPTDSITLHNLLERQ